MSLFNWSWNKTPKEDPDLQKDGTYNFTNNEPEMKLVRECGSFNEYTIVCSGVVGWADSFRVNISDTMASG